MTNKDKTKQAFEMIEEGVKEIYTSNNFKQYLLFLSKFHNYSLGNTILILKQNPNATLVAGYHKWVKDFHRHVNQGQKGITILAPFQSKKIISKEIRDEHDNVVYDKDGNAIIEDKEIDTIRFKTTTVFDISQTSGEPIPSFLDDLKGSSNQITAIIQSIQEVCTTPIEFHSSTNDMSLKNGAKGYYSPLEDKIVINQELEDLHIAKTLIHEYAHSILHKQTDKDMSQREVEAESLAFVICNHFGLDTSEYSFGYIASYANQDYELLHSILENIQSNAHEMIKEIEPIFKEKLQMIEDQKIEHLNYLAFKEIAAPLLTNSATYIKYTSKGMMDLNIEILDEDRYAMAHNFVLNGDMMADPDIEFTIDKDHELLYPQTYQQDNLQYFDAVNDDPIKSKNLSIFMKTWFSNIKEQEYKVNTIYTEEEQITNKSEIHKFCIKHGIKNMAPQLNKGLER